MAELSIAERPLRADARRNRARVLAAAREAFAAEGLDAQIDDIAHHAGVGVGTVYRHFPTKEALIEALLVERFDHLLDAARAALARDAEPWDAFEGFVWDAARIHADDRALGEITAKRPTVIQDLCPGSEELHETAGELVRRAQAAGELRDDFSADDFPTIMCGLGGMMQREESAGGGWERYLRFVIDGLRAR